jgi:hypothetical protein
MSAFRVSRNRQLSVDVEPGLPVKIQFPSDLRTEFSNRPGTRRSPIRIHSESDFAQRIKIMVSFMPGVCLCADSRPRHDAGGSRSHCSAFCFPYLERSSAEMRCPQNARFAARRAPTRTQRPPAGCGSCRTQYRRRRFVPAIGRPCHRAKLRSSASRSLAWRSMTWRSS